MLNENNPDDFPSSLPSELPAEPAYMSAPEISYPQKATERRRPIHPDTLMKAAVGLGIAMIVGAFVWASFRHQSLLTDLRPSALWQVGPGMIVGALFAWITWILGKRLSAMRQIVRMLESALDLNAMTFRHVILFSLLAAIPEEILFRGALQTEAGLIVAAVVFGTLHALTRAYFVFATAAGLALGLLYILGGSLWMPIGAHFAVDVVTFMLLLQRQQHYLD